MNPLLRIRSAKKMLSSGQPAVFSLTPLVPWRTLPRPIPWGTVFEREAPLHVELGFGLGDFLVRSSLENPEVNYVGLEIDWFLIRRTLQKISLSGARHVALVQADARMALERLFRPQSIHAAWAMFPCPWPKPRHADKRLISKLFLHLLNSRLIPGGQMVVVTDDQDHSQWIVTESQQTGFTVQAETVPPQFATKYERKWQKRGQNHFYRLRFTKDRHIPFQEKKEIPVQSRIVPCFRAEDLPLETLKGTATIVPKEILYDSRQERAMVRVLVIEADFFQDIWLEVVRKPDGWHIRPAKGCGMIPTPGIQEALDLFEKHLRQHQTDPSSHGEE